MENFLKKLRERAENLSVEEKQKVLRLVVKEILVGKDYIVIKHAIPTTGKKMKVTNCVGGVVTPTICNMVLDGLEEVVRNCGPIRTHGLGRRPTSAYKINFIRYCDDFIITASMKEVLDEKVIPALNAFLEPRGLILSEEKTKITRIEEGFDFLGQNIRKYGSKLLITPSKLNLQSLFTKIKTIFAKMKAASAWALIRKLNPVLKGWAYYHRHIVAKATYSKVDYFIFLKLRRWLKRKHPDKSWKWINRKYYQHPYSGKSQFFDRGKDNEVVTHFKVSTVEIKRHVKIKGDANPFDPQWEMFFEDRHDKKMLQSTSGKLRKLYLRQEGRCKVCQAKITRETGWNTHHVVPKHLGGSDNLENQKLSRTKRCGEKNSLDSTEKHGTFKRDLGS